MYYDKSFELLGNSCDHYLQFSYTIRNRFYYKIIEIDSFEMKRQFVTINKHASRILSDLMETIK